MGALGIGGVMAISVGMRISGLLVAGVLVCTTTAACGGDGEGRSGGSREPSVSAGTSSGGQDAGGTGDSASVGGVGGVGDSSSSGSGMGTWRPSDEAAAGRSGSGGGDSEGSDSEGKNLGRVDRPSWLRPGPRSPNTEQSPDPEFIFDELGEKPDECAETLRVIEAQPDNPQWQVLRGLAHACLGLQGQGGDWNGAAQLYAATEGAVDTCKGRAARVVLGDALRFHRQHPSTTVRLQSSAGSSGANVCNFRISSVSAGAAGAVKAGERVTIEVSGAYFSPSDLISVNVLFDEERSFGGFEIGSQTGDSFSFTAEIPPFDTYPRTVDVTVQYGSEATLKDAVTVLDPNASGSSPEVPSSPVTSSP